MVSNGVEGLQEVRRWRPELIVTDIEMPYMDGLMFCRQIREESQVPIIVLSAHSDPDAAIKARAAGANEFVQKPFSLPDLYERIVALHPR